MKSNYEPFLVTKNAGRSLAELLIAIGIGIIILLAITTLFFTNSQASRGTDEKARLESEGRLALSLISFHLRMAGYGELTDADPNPESWEANSSFFDPSIPIRAGASRREPPKSIEGCTGSFSDPVALTVSCAGNTQPDSVVVRYFVDTFNSNASGGAPTDCLGQAVSANLGLNTIVENRFFVRTNPTTLKSELYCVGNGGNPVANLNAPQPISENIIDMKVRYSIGLKEGLQSATTPPVDATTVAATVIPLPLPPTPPPPVPVDPWSRVVSVNVCLVAQSANDGVATSPQQYRNCAGQLITPTDKRLYATFSTVITLRSRASGSI